MFSVESIVAHLKASTDHLCFYDDNIKREFIDFEQFARNFYRTWQQSFDACARHALSCNVPQPALVDLLCSITRYAYKPDIADYQF